MDILINILTLGLKPLYVKNKSYYVLVNEFRKKLPRPQNRARKITAEKIDQNPFLPNSMKSVNAIDLSTLKPDLTEQDLDFFINSIEQFDYSWMIHRKYYKNYSANILRLNPEGKAKNFDLAILQLILSDTHKPLKPIDVLIYHLKYEYKLTSFFLTKFWLVFKSKD